MQQLHRFRGRCFIWAGAVHDDLPIACPDKAAGFDLIEMHHHGARNLTRVELIRIASTNVDQLDRFPASINARSSCTSMRGTPIANAMRLRHQRHPM